MRPSTDPPPERPQALTAPRLDPALLAGTRRRDDSWPAWPEACSDPDLERWLALAEPVFISCAEWNWQEGEAIPRRSIPTCTLGWHYHGSGTLVLAGRRHRLQPGTLSCIPAGSWHSVSHDPGAPLCSIGLHVQADVAAGGTTLWQLLGLPPTLELQRERDQPIATGLRLLTRLAAARPPGWRVFAQAELLAVLRHLLLYHGTACRPRLPGAVPDPGRLAPALARIEQDLADPALSVAELAALLGVSTVHLRTLFQAVVGCGPRRYLQRRRLDAACRLLRQSDAGIDEIARRVGFSAGRVLHRLFRQQLRTTPQQWRQAP